MKRRQGFTLVELMVSMALIIFIMAILSSAFIAALNVFRDLKGQGDLAEKLRATTQVLQGDLAADHFDAGRRLSDSNFWSNGPPSQGFFRIWQGSAPTNNPLLVNAEYASYIEGLDPDGLPSYRTTNHVLAFTVKKRGNDMGDFLSASLAGSGLGTTTQLGTIQTFGPPEARYQASSGGAYNYQWAEVAWFLQPQVNPNTSLLDTTVPDTQGVNPQTGLPPYPPMPLYTLYRRQRLLVPDNTLVVPQQPYTGAAPANPTNFMEMSCWANTSTLYGNTGTNLYFNSPADITVPSRRFGMVYPNATPGSPQQYIAGLPYATNPSLLTSYTSWPLLAPSGIWALPNAALGASPAPPVPTYPLSPTIPPQYPYGYYPTLAQQVAPSSLWGADIQLNDVVSFDVSLLVAGVIPVPFAGTNPIPPTIDPFVTLFHPAFTLTPAQGGVPPLPIAPLISYNNGNPAFYSFNNAVANPAAPAVFDTWTSIKNDGFSNSYANWNTPGNLTSIPQLWTPYALPPALQAIAPQTPNGPIIKALRITIRIWDFKTNQTRQVTIVQAM